jgi:hypothetical protein
MRRLLSIIQRVDGGRKAGEGDLKAQRMMSNRYEYAVHCGERRDTFGYGVRISHSHFPFPISHVPYPRTSASPSGRLAQLGSIWI